MKTKQKTFKKTNNEKQNEVARIENETKRSSQTGHTVYFWSFLLYGVAGAPSM